LAQNDLENNSLIDMVKKGHKQAFCQLAKKYYGTTIYYLMGFGLSRADAEDVAQEAFINAYTKIDQFKSSGSFISWFLRIARNQHIDKLRREKKGDIPVDTYNLQEFPGDRTPEDKVISDSSVNDVFSLLKPKERVMIELRVFQSLPFSEIAEILGSSEGNVRLIFHRLITRLRKLHERTEG